MPRGLLALALLWLATAGNGPVPPPEQSGADLWQFDTGG